MSKLNELGGLEAISRDYADLCELHISPDRNCEVCIVNALVERIKELEAKRRVIIYPLCGEGIACETAACRKKSKKRTANGMSKLDDLGGIEAAKEMQRCLRDEGDIAAERTVAALIERVEELERNRRQIICVWCGCVMARSEEMVENVKLCREHDLACKNNPMTAKLQSYRELAEMVVKYDEQCEPGATYWDEESVDWKAVVAKARETLERDAKR